MRKRACKTCDFWSEWSDEETEYDSKMTFTRGYCHRHAPTPATTEELINDEIWEKHHDQHFDTIWPNTKSHEWCGDYLKQQEDE